MLIQSLNQIGKNQIHQIQQIEKNDEFGELDDLIGQRLADLGFCRGAMVEVVSKGILGVGPYAVRLGNQSQFSLRQAEAKKVLCVPVQAA